MALENLYSLNKKEISMIYKDLAINFCKDDLYVAVFPNDETRLEVLEIFFQEYIKAMEPYCHFYADSAQRLSVMMVFDSRKYKHHKIKYRRSMAFMNVKMLKLMKAEVPAPFQALKSWDMFTSRWVDEFVNKDYFHLDLLYTKEQFRMQGLSSKMLIELVRDAYDLGMDITMETHHNDNIRFYEKFGFVLMNTISDNKLKQYCLLLRNDRES